MPFFKTNKISGHEQDISEILKNARLEAGIAFDQAVKETRISRKYLKALEEGDYHVLPDGLYQENYIKKYSSYLGLNPDYILQVFRSAGSKAGTGRFFIARAHRAHQYVSLPKILKNILISCLFLGVLAYLGYYLNNITKEPELKILRPAQDQVIDGINYEIAGRTEAEAEVTINGEVVLADTDGFFYQEVNFKKGVNTIVVTAKKKYSRINTVVRKVIVE